MQSIRACRGRGVCKTRECHATHSRSSTGDRLAIRASLTIKDQARLGLGEQVRILGGFLDDAFLRADRLVEAAGSATAAATVSRKTVPFPWRQPPPSGHTQGLLAVAEAIAGDHRPQPRLTVVRRRIIRIGPDQVQEILRRIVETAEQNRFQPGLLAPRDTRATGAVFPRGPARPRCTFLCVCRLARMEWARGSCSTSPLLSRSASDTSISPHRSGAGR